MADPRFFTNSGPISLKTLTETYDVKIIGCSDYERTFTDVAPIHTAEDDHITFLSNSAYKESLSDSKAGACILRASDTRFAPDNMILITTPQPYHIYSLIAACFYNINNKIKKISKQAVIHVNSKIGENCNISPGVIIEENVEIGSNCEIEANAVISRGCKVGKNTIIGSGASLSYCFVGEHAIIHHGVRIGGDGFGFALGHKEHIKVPQLGRVIIGNHVEIGANSTVDRGTGPDTIIHNGVKIDNLVQIAHNVEIGEGCVIVSQAGVSGSTSVGSFSLIGGQAGIAGHLKIGPGSKISGQSGVIRNTKPNSKIFGTPAKDSSAYFREITMLAKLAQKKRD